MVGYALMCSFRVICTSWVHQVGHLILTITAIVVQTTVYAEWHAYKTKSYLDGLPLSVYPHRDIQVVAPSQLLDDPNLPPREDTLRVTPLLLLQLQRSMGKAVAEPRRLYRLP